MPRKTGWRKNPNMKRRMHEVLKALPEQAAIEAHDAVRQNAEEAVRIIRGDTPVDDGALKASVDWTYGDPPKGILGGTAVKHTNIPDDLRISIYAGGLKAPHAHLVHNGTGERSNKSGASRGVMPPQPFFWPNIRALRKRMRARISRKIRKGMQKAVK